MTGTDVAVVVGAVALIAMLAWFFFGSRKARLAELRGAAQEATVTVKGWLCPETPGWQVREEERALRVLVAAPAAGLDQQATERAVQAALSAAGALALPVHVSVVDAIPAGGAGKRPLVVARA